MFKRVRKKFTKEPEYSLRLRGIVLAAMMVPLLALVRVHGGLLPYVFITAIGIGLGHWYSYINIKKQSNIVRSIMFVAIHVALCWMFFGLAIGATVPQAQFAVFAQAITSFDLRYRSSLFNTLIHSLAILYVAATLSRTTELAVYLVLFTVLALAAFFVAEKESGQNAATIAQDEWQKQTTRLAVPGRSLTLFGISFAAITLVAIFVVFLFTPRYANRPLVPPFTLNLPLRGGTQSEIINPGVPLVQVNGWSDGSSDYYYGFDTNLDLRYRGGLSDQLVMYVRSPSRSYWRSHSYNFYNGTTWSQDDTSLTDLENRGVYFELPAPLGSPQSQAEMGEIQPDGRRVLQDEFKTPRHVKEALNLDDDIPPEDTWRNNQQIVQTYNIVSNQPNLVFAAYRPAEIFITADRVSIDRGDGIRLPEAMKAGMTYSVVSYLPNFNPDELRQVDTLPYPPEITERYLQLPGNITPRTRELARSLSAPHNNNFDKIQAINDHLLTKYPYNFFPPPHPPGAEVVDTFLFEDQEGVCEQYVTSLVVMARSLGIPARLAAGYGSGDYNAITGYYEVRYSHAHSWAEVYFPEYGWVPFDPTPGWTPQPYPTPAQNWLLSNNGQLFNQLTGLDLPIGAMASGGLAGLAFFTPFLVGSALLVGLVLLLFYLGRHLRRVWASKQTSRYSQIENGGKTRRLILKLYHQGVRFLHRKRYRKRYPWETLAEYSSNAAPLPGLSRLTQLAEIAAYRPNLPDEDTVGQAKEALADLKAEAKKSPQK